ncbi:uncharacterized protein LOC116133354 [Pistacia vera]|uniref:uncharacterized protein LOC116133354 n=1 Tax=Pistacia vera TaxID=55513 RepID=UPI001262E789|nr:uncharacterized protein LOC116133354 [Pistacia vera]
MTAPNIQRELTSVCAHLMTKKIIAEIVKDKQPFSLLVDESRDEAVKEQMAIVFRYVDNIGYVIERFIGVVHVKNSSAKSLKIAIDAFFVKHGLSLTSLRGQEYWESQNELSQALQGKDQDLLNAIQFVQISKRRLHKMRNEDTCFDILLKKASDMCKDNDIPILENMEDNFARTKQGIAPITNKHHFKVELMYTILDDIQEELNNRFDEVNMRLLQCMSSLDLGNSFIAFNKDRLLEFAKFYPTNFPQHDIWLLDDKLENYYEDVNTNANFTHVKGIADLAKKMVEFKKDVAYNKVFLLIKLALVLPVAIATIEGVFSAMNLVKNSLRNRMGDDWMNNCLVVYIEKEVFATIENGDIIEHFQNISKQKIVLN